MIRLPKPDFKVMYPPLDDRPKRYFVCGICGLDIILEGKTKADFGGKTNDQLAEYLNTEVQCGCGATGAWRRKYERRGKP